MKNRFYVNGPITTIWVKHKGSLFPCLIDTEDLPKVASICGSWHARWVESCKRHYAYTVVAKDGVKRHTQMHRLILDAPMGLEVDHIHHNGIDNRKSEIRLATRSENGANRRGAARSNKTGHRGITFRQSTGAYRVTACHRGKNVEVGRFKTLAAALQGQADYAGGMEPCPPKANGLDAWMAWHRRAMQKRKTSSRILGTNSVKRA